MLLLVFFVFLQILCECVYADCAACRAAVAADPRNLHALYDLAALTDNSRARWLALEIVSAFTCDAAGRALLRGSKVNHGVAVARLIDAVHRVARESAGPRELAPLHTRRAMHCAALVVTHVQKMTSGCDEGQVAVQLVAVVSCCQAGSFGSSFDTCVMYCNLSAP